MMWLLKTDTLELEHFIDERAVSYAILSHTWGHEEVTFQEMRGPNPHPHPQSKEGYRKIQQTCQQAANDGHDHVWIDTCCINKESSAELSEAINSMFNYYATAKVCYAYLADVTWQPDASRATTVDASYDEGRELLVALHSSRWFTRGWTLQELIAPSEVVFFDSTWTRIQSKRDMWIHLCAITKIDREVLEGGIKDLGSYSCAAKMSWAANRETTRLEDRAYSLMGLFDVNMPLLYGEGTKAFQRLQEEILQRTEDQSLLAWNCAQPSNEKYGDRECAILAPSPEHFAGMSNVVRWRGGRTSPVQLTNVALEINLPLLQVETLMGGHEHLIILNCHLKDDLTGPLALCVSVERGDISGNGELHCHVRRREMLRGAYERVAVAPYNFVVKAAPRRCCLYPRFSQHDHSPRWRRIPMQLSKICSVRPIWVQTSSDSKKLTFELVGREPEGQWSTTGLFDPPGQVRSGQNIWRVQLWKYRHGYGFGPIEAELLNTWTVGLAFENNDGTFKVRLFDAAERVNSGQRAANLLEASFPDCRSMELDDCIRVSVDVKISKDILDYDVDLISVYAERISKEISKPKGSFYR